VTERIDARPPRWFDNFALRFILLIGVLSFFADFTYEGARSVLGPFLLTLGASATIVGIVTGFGEFLGYALRLVSGRLADRTQRFWPITIFGYVVQMAAVPALFFAQNWPTAAVLIILERVGKAIRNPPRDVMLSHAAQRVGGYGWAFGLHEALDQAGAMVGPLVVAAVLAVQGSYQIAFAVLLVPALINLTLVAVARLTYPNPAAMEAPSEQPAGQRLPQVYWVYLGGAALVAAGFADYPLIAFHFERAGIADGQMIAVLYAVAMAVSGGSSLPFGRLYDRFGFVVIIFLTAVAALFAPLVFFGNFWVAALGAAIWGMGMGVHESIIPAAVAPMVPPDRRASAFGLFTAAYGIAWFAGSALIGILYDRSVMAAVILCVGLELVALWPLMVAWRSIESARPLEGHPRKA
jgi:predicted MFS family arabinose efflux permease